MRQLKIGERVICTVNGIVGNIVKIYYPTACEEQIMVDTDDGRQYHAPTRLWVPFNEERKELITYILATINQESRRKPHENNTIRY